MSDHEAMLAIQALLSGVEWDVETIESVAAIVNKAGYPVLDVDGVEL